MSHVEQRKEQEKKVLAMMEEAKRSLAETKKAIEERKKQADAEAEKKFKLRFTRLLAETHEGKSEETESSVNSESSK